MNEEKYLKKEIIKRIMGNLGIVPNHNFGKVGITLDDFYVGEDLELIDDGQDKTYNKIYCGIVVVDDFKIKSLFVSIGADPGDQSDDACEFILILKPDNAPVYGLAICEDYEFGSFLMKVADDSAKVSWIPASILVQSQILTAIEQITQEGIMWEPCKEYAELKGCVLSVLERI
jgi:hypothetical protein